MVTFEQAALAWLQKGTSRNREPFRPKTIKTYKSQIETHLIPAFGSVPAHLVGNNEVATLVQLMVDNSLAASTIDLNVNIIKQIRKSLRGPDGQKLPTYEWDSEVIDAPILDKKLQKRPIPSVQTLQEAAKCAPAHTRVLIYLLAGTGLRINEALALKAIPDDGNSNVWLPAESKIIVREQLGGGNTKTAAGVREVDLPKVLNDYLLSQSENLHFPRMFKLSESYYRAHLAKCGIVGGFHALRRFRITHIRTEGVPDPMVHFWVGHEDETVTDGYTIVKSEIEKRKTLVERVGLGFQLPEVR